MLLLFPLIAGAHIGSPNVFFEGPAGPYPIHVMIQPPGVVPGLAQIHVTVRSGHARSVTVLPVRWDAGTRGAPPPDVAAPVPGETNLFTAQLWLMDSGAYSVFVDVNGPDGHGTAIVPLNSVAYQRLGMSTAMTVMFTCLGLFLVLLLISVVGAAIRESGLPPGVEPALPRRRLAVLAGIIALVVAVTALFLGNKWWEAVDRSYRRRLYQEQAVSAQVLRDAGGTSRLQLSLPRGRRREDDTPLVPDHGHLMHLFLIRQPQGDVFAHMHPARGAEGEGVFVTRLPALPAGDYQVYADITRESGFTRTLTNTLRLDAAAAADAGADSHASPDDSVSLEAPRALAPLDWPGGLRLKPMDAPPFRAGKDLTLRFQVTTDTGEPARLEPYLGMYGHLLIQCADGSVFTHLHPLGSISMASQKGFAEREHAGYLANQSLDLLCSPATPALSFPFSFPKPGEYRLWLQTKVQGQIRTASYVVTVD